VSTPLPRAQQLRLQEHQVFLVLTIVVGVVAGLAAVLFTVAIEQTSHRLFGLAPSRARLFAVPPLVSLVTGVMLAKFFPDVRGSGVPQTEAAYHLSSGIIRGRIPFGKFITGVLCIGSGHSMGREGPSVQIGAGLASLVGQWLHLSPRRVRDLIPVGAAGALAAAFNTPVAAVLFALEEIIGDMNAPLLGSTVVASVAAVIVERSILGNEPLFHVPGYHLVHPAELIAYAALGILGGLLSLLFCKGLLGLRRLFARLPRSTGIIQPAMGGLVIGVMLMYWPAIMGVGYEYVDQALNGGLLLKTMAALSVLKLAATIVSYASGNAGGIFGPSLYIGAMAGGAVGMVVHRLAPFPTGDPGAYALVGMGTLFAGIIRAPMTSVFMIFEITQDYQILVPLMVANMLSFAISKRYQPAPVYHALLHQDGVHLPSPATQALTTVRTARQVMQTDVSLIPADTSIEHAWQMTVENGAPAYLVGTRDRLVGSVSHQQLEDSRRLGKAADPVASIVDPSFVHAHGDHPIDVVLERFAQSGGILPVVSRGDAHRVEGVITIDSMLKIAERRAHGRESHTATAGARSADAGNRIH
jgi:CIC family chloride channel protein